MCLASWLATRRRTAYVHAAHMHAATAIAHARAVLNQVRAVGTHVALTSSRLEQTVTPEQLAQCEHLAVAAGALATRVAILWSETPDARAARSDAEVADILVADSAHAALADARTPLTPAGVRAALKIVGAPLWPPKDDLGEWPMDDDLEDMANTLSLVS